ncbi:unnamed protein product [Calypogeia fissa]
MAMVCMMRPSQERGVLAGGHGHGEMQSMVREASRGDHEVTGTTTVADSSSDTSDPCYSCNDRGAAVEACSDHDVGGEVSGPLRKTSSAINPNLAGSHSHGQSVLDFGSPKTVQQRLGGVMASLPWPSLGFKDSPSAYLSSGPGWTAHKTSSVSNPPREYTPSSDLASQSRGNPGDAYYFSMLNNGGLMSEDMDHSAAGASASMMGCNNSATLVDQWGNPMQELGMESRDNGSFVSYMEERGSGNCNGSTEGFTTTQQDMDESAIDWDHIVSEFVEAMPGVPIEQLLQSLSETLTNSCNFQVGNVIDARLRSYGSNNNQFIQSPPSPELTSLSDQSGSSRGSKRSRESGGGWDSDEMGAEEPPHRALNSGNMVVGDPQPHPQQQQHQEEMMNQFVSGNRHVMQQHQQPSTAQVHPMVGRGGNPLAMPQEQAGNLEHGAQGEAIEVGTGPVAAALAQNLEKFTEKDEEGLHLLGLLMQCAEALSADNYDAANEILPQLHEFASPYGTPVQRVAAYFAEGMSSRLLNCYIQMCNPLPKIQLLGTQTIVAAFQVFNGICPFVKFSHFTANQAILEAFEGEGSVHIIDIDIMQGLQWPALFHILAARPGGPPRVRITGLGTSMDALEATGRRLSNFAQSLGLPFQYTPVAERIGNVDAKTLKVRKGDVLAVHWLHHSLYDVTGSDIRTLQLLQSLSPKVITMVEQDLSFSGSFLNRFVEALHYYSALFDSLGASFPEDHGDRHIVEQQLLSCEIKNILAVGGPARTGEVKFEQWRDQLGQAGFKPVSLSGNAATQASLLLGMFPCEGYTLVKQNGTLKLGWKDLCLYTASAWKC